jgi:L-lysine exporter family protein LysE/ArgO
MIAPWQSYLQGLLVMGGLIVAIGAQNAFVIAQGLRRRHHLAVAAVCVLCDATLVGLGVFGLGALLASSPTLLSVARWGGAGFLLCYGVGALRRAWRPAAMGGSGQGETGSGRAVLLATLAVTLLNPHVYLDTVLLIGALGAQQPDPLAYTLGASSASLLWFFSLALGAAWLSPWLARPATWRLLDLAVAVMMFLMAGRLLVGH